MNFEIAERNYGSSTERSFFNMQERIEKIRKERNAQIEFDVENVDGEYYFLKPENILEAITESGMTFQNKLGAAMQANDSQAVLKIIADESRTYWTQWLEAITE
jgi:hypothetical protein